MIEHLRRKITVLVLAVLFLITCLFVAAINLINWHDLNTQAEETLQQLMLGSGDSEPPVPPKNEDGMPLLPEEQAGDADERHEPSGERPPQLPGQPVSDRMMMAGLASSYTVMLGEDGLVRDWFSDRSSLYTDDQIQELVSAIQTQGRVSGRIGTQFFRWDQEQGRIVVLDERMNMLNARDLLKTTLLAGLATYLCLGIGAVLLISRMFVPVAQAYESQKQFVSDASHELKTPLAVISANAEALSSEIGDNEWLGYIQSEVERTTQLVENLLTLARTDQMNQEISMTDIDLSHGMLEVILPLESIAFEQGTELILNIPDEPVHVTGNEAMLKQLTVILTSNAIKYAAQGTQITISLTSRAHGAVLSVHDFGPAIPEKEQARIFDRFYRSDTSRSSQGHGLGLAIAKNIVRIHHGEITVHSDETQGTTFEVVLPG